MLRRRRADLAATSDETRLKDAVSTGIGETLREAREASGRTLDDMAQLLRARVTQLQDLEQERFDNFGGDVYAKGFLKSYAIELGVDPQPLLEVYRRQVGHDDVHATALVTGVTRSPRQRSAPPAWIAWVLVAVVVLAVLGVVRELGGGPTPDIASPGDFTEPPPDPAADGDGGSDDVDTDPGEQTDTDTEEADAAGVEEEDEDEPDIEGVDLLLALEEAVWMRVIIDGSLVEERTVPAGETIQYTGDQEIQIRFGNAGGVRAQLNGEDLGSQGARGDVVDVVFTPDGSEIL